MKKVVSIALTLIMVLSSVSALAEGFVLADSYDVGTRAFNAGNVTLEAAPAGGGTVTTDVFAGEEGKDYTDEKVYTYNDYTSAITSSMNWDVLSWETNEDSAITDYIISGFYTFKMNSDKTGYSIVPEAAAEMPVDVTAEYVGKMGVKEGETGKAWRIALNPEVCFNDGTKVNADDYIYSMQQQLNPKMLNRRADSYYAGQLTIYNAKNCTNLSIKQLTDERDKVTMLGKLANLGDDIQAALDESEWFIAICSPRYLESRWCQRELEYFLEKKGRDRVLAVLVEGEPEETACEEIIEKVAEAGYTTVVLRPLMVVAGDHANNDMADPEDPESWLSMFVASEKFEKVLTQIAGLGRIPEIQALYVAHTGAVLAETGENAA